MCTYNIRISKGAVWYVIVVCNNWGSADLESSSERGESLNAIESLLVGLTVYPEG